MTLKELPVGLSATIDRMHRENPSLSRQCHVLGLRPGATIQVLRRSRGSGPMQIKCLGTLFAIRAEEADHIRVIVD